MPRSSIPPLPVSMSTCAPNWAGTAMVTSPDPVSTYNDSMSDNRSRCTLPLPVSMLVSGDLIPEVVTLPDPVSTLSTSTSTRSAVTSPEPVSSLSWRPRAPVTATFPEPVSRLTSPSASLSLTSPDPVSTWSEPLTWSAVTFAAATSTRRSPETLETNTRPTARFTATRFPAGTATRRSACASSPRPWAEMRTRRPPPNRRRPSWSLKVPSSRTSSVVLPPKSGSP